jgi:hypothetical protein
VHESSSDARRGTGIHAFLERIAQSKPREESLELVDASIRELCEKIPTGLVPTGGETEVAMAWDTYSATGRRLNLSASREYDVSPTEIPGTADLILWNPNRPVVIDWKTTAYAYDPREARLQLEFYALCAASISWSESVECAVGVVSEDGSITYHRWELLPADLDRVMMRVGQIYRNVKRARETELAELDTSKGPHCQYCPSWRSCPAHTRAVQQMAFEPVPTLTESSIGEAYAAMLAAEKTAEAVRDATRQFVREHGPIKLGSNKLLVLDTRGALRQKAI